MEKHYRHTIESAKGAKDYFEKLSITLARADIERWDKEIINAEKDRLDNPAAMDVMACRQVTNATEGADDSTIKDNNNAVEWIMHGFAIEEKQ